MNCLNYEILFIENDLKFIGSIELIISHFLSDLGFNLNSSRETGKDFSMEKFDKVFDLILLDLNLYKDILGSDLIQKIRDNENVSDILFYSDDLTNFDNQLKTLGNVDGVYFCRGRKYLLPKIKKLILKSIKKQQEVSNLRGLVISEAIDLEAKMSKIIIKFFGLLNHPREGLFYEKILDPEVFMLGRKSNLMNSICGELKSDLAKQIIGSKKGEKEKEKKILEEVNAVHTECKNISKEIVDIRNVLSHVKESDANPKILKSILPQYKEVIIDDLWCINTRKNLIKHSKNLDILLDKIF
jgi:hypothetical protein